MHSMRHCDIWKQKLIVHENKRGRQTQETAQRRKFWSYFSRFRRIIRIPFHQNLSIICASQNARAKAKTVLTHDLNAICQSSKSGERTTYLCAFMESVEWAFRVIANLIWRHALYHRKQENPHLVECLQSLQMQADSHQENKCKTG
jgi:hypothetical protein